jgi:hypothetical protein
MSLLKVNEVQNYNGSSLTLTASTVSTSAQLNTGGNISVTGSLNVSDDSTTRSNLGLGSIATQASDNIAVTGGTATLGALTVSGSDSGDLVRITQTGSGNALVVEDSANPDSSPFVVDSSGNVGIGTISPSSHTNFGPILDLSGGNPSISLHDTDGTSFYLTSTGTQFIIQRGNTSDTLLSSPFFINGSGKILLPDVYNNAVSSSRDLQIKSTGEIGYPTSIRAAKTNISNLESFDWIYDLNPVSFQYRTKDEEDNYTNTPEEQIEYGLIAEEVETVNSDLVFYDETENGLELRGVQYSRLIAPLIKAIQDQRSQILSLTERIETLEAT